MTRDLMHRVVYQLFSSYTPSIDGHQAGKTELRNIRSALTALAVASCDVGDPSLSCLERWAKFVQSFSDFTEFADFLKPLAAQLVNQAASGGKVRDFIGPDPRIAEMIRPIRVPLINALGDPVRHLAPVYSWLKLVTKLHVPNESLSAASLEKWVAAEENIISPPEEYVAAGRRVFRALRPFDPMSWRYHNGPGQVAERFRYPELERVSKSTILGHSTPDALLRKVIDTPWLTSGKVLDRTNVLTFVPKTATSLRAISMEPALLAFSQQGVRHQLYDAFERGQFRDRIHLRAREHNQALAWLGSKNGDWATIDLSSASDSVSREWVAKASVGTSWFWPLMATRSLRTLLPDGTIFPIRKFAPMGSATAFPTEVLAFYAVILCAIDELRPPRPGNHFLVYGDDLICHKSIADCVVDKLTQFGYTVNRDKSFLTGPFRESCGGEYYAGVDITPLYHRVNYSSDTVVSSLSAHANNACFHSFFRLREYYITEAKGFEAPGRPTSFSMKPDDVFIFSTCPHGGHEYRRAPSADGVKGALQFSQIRRTLPTQRFSELERSAYADDVEYQLMLADMVDRAPVWPGGPLYEDLPDLGGRRSATTPTAGGWSPWEGDYGLVRV